MRYTNVEIENMKVIRPKNDLIEIFGYSPDDTSNKCRTLWKLGACPFISRKCSKHNNDNSVTYGVCSVTTSHGDCIICPNRLYAERLITLSTVSKDAFGDIKFVTFQEYIENDKNNEYVVALGMHSGHEIGGKSFSMDWVLAKVNNGKLIAYTGAEVQSLDITGNYRDCWYGYKNISEDITIPKSCHGLNWANVHKRLIPQIIRKSLIYSTSPYVSSGLYFILPDIVYQKFEDIIGSDIPLQSSKSSDIITVYTWGLGDKVDEGNIRKLRLIRKIRFKLSDFSERFISGPNLPDHTVLDNAVKKALAVE